MSIDEQINNLKSQVVFYKIQLNSTYGLNVSTKQTFFYHKKICSVKRDIKELEFIKMRINKIQKIKNNIIKWKE